MSNTIFSNLNKPKMQEYIVDDNENSNGLIAISKESLERIAEITALESEDIVVDKKRFATCKINEGKLVINIDVKLKYGANVNAVVSTLQQKIHKNILNMTGQNAEIVNVKITSFEIV